MRLSHLVATVCGIGHLRPASGTWGSLAALPLAYLLIVAGGLWLFLPAIVAAYAAGLWATRVETAGKANHDPSEIVIDEVVGQWIALLPIVLGVQMTGAAPERLWPGWIGAFLMFRLFDIWKPGPIGRADRRNDFHGVMLDDVLAGVAAAVVTALAAAIAHGVLM
ncbi:phosphatidylglycerophosphatase A family protein [Oceaniglobus roseus]|uniref:phosphatidylglycerophosphatase A family protein n=1 Tax=Oceaniglobus roseus TaxID=1737570 RepID=UPI000C7F53F2|nr:phosphatidylglycerophosphatase A [Kandeliimicrobium roseum]